MTEKVRTPLHCVDYHQNYVTIRRATTVQVISTNIQTNYEMHMLGKDHDNEAATAIAKYLPREQILFLIKGSYCDLIFYYNKVKT